MDPFPHTSIEAKLFSNNMNYITLISDVDGAVDAFEEDECIYVDPRNSDQFSKKIIEAVNMEYSEKEKKIERSNKTIEKFDFPKIMLSFIKDNLN
jgi:trehalose-6-phosphate synthase